MFTAISLSNIVKTMLGCDLASRDPGTGFGRLSIVSGGEIVPVVTVILGSAASLKERLIYSPFELSAAVTSTDSISLFKNRRSHIC